MCLCALVQHICMCVCVSACVCVSVRICCRDRVGLGPCLTASAVFPALPPPAGLLMCACGSACTLNSPAHSPTPARTHLRLPVVSPHPPAGLSTDKVTLAEFEAELAGGGEQEPSWDLPPGLQEYR